MTQHGFAPAHGGQRVWPQGYGHQDGCLTIGGQPVTHWVDRNGGETPLFIYDRALMRRRVGQLRAALPERVQLHYAMKANPHPDVVQVLAGLVDGIDVASQGELAVALQTAVPVEDISFAGPGKRDSELRAAVQAGIVLNIESEGELERAAAIASVLGKPLKAALRVNPDFDLKSSGMRMGGGARPFGIDEARIPAALAQLDRLGAQFFGFHIYAGSQNLSAQSIIESQARTLELAVALSAHAPAPPRFFNIGGGFGVPYAPADQPLDLPAVGSALGEALSRLPDAFARTKIVLELGRYMVAEAGIYLTRVVDRKLSHGETFLITDGGLHHQLAASGNFGQVIRRNYPVALANRFDSPAVGPVNVVGCLCTPLDKLGEKVDFPDAQVGDLVVVFLAGAYGASASPAAFLSHPAPAELLV